MRWRRLCPIGLNNSFVRVLIPEKEQEGPGLVVNLFYGNAHFDSVWCDSSSLPLFHSRWEITSSRSVVCSIVCCPLVLCCCFCSDPFSSLLCFMLQMPEFHRFVSHKYIQFYFGRIFDYIRQKILSSVQGKMKAGSVSNCHRRIGGCILSWWTVVSKTWLFEYEKSST